MRVLASAIFLLALATSPAFAADLKIGVAGPMSGGLAAFGEQIQHGTQIAIDDINQHGGLLGQKIALFSADDACDPKQAHNVAGKMASEKVAAVFGHWCSAASMAASTVYGEENILQIDVGGLLTKFTYQNLPNLFRVSANSKSYAAAVGRYTAQHNPNATVAIITDQPAVTKELALEMQTYFAGTKNKIVAMEDIRGGDKDFSNIIDHLKTVHPDVVICSCYTIEAGLLGRQMLDKKLDVFYYGMDTFNSPDFLKIVGAENAAKMISIDYARAPQSAAYEKLAAVLREYQWPVETTTILTYAAMQIYAEAVKTAQSTDTAKVVQAMHNRKFSTIIGDVVFDDHGDRINPAFASYQWVNGQLKATGIVKSN